MRFQESSEAHAVRTRIDWSNLFGPTTALETFRLLRPRNHFLSRAITAAALGTCGYLLLEPFETKIAYSPADQQRVVRGAVVLIAHIQMLIAVFAAPLTLGQAIGTEKASGTFSLLLITDLAGRDIVFSKVLSSATNAFFISLTGTPLLVALSFFGGIDLARIVTMVAALFIAAIASAAWAMPWALSSNDAKQGSARALASLLVPLMLAWLVVAMGAILYAGIAPFLKRLAPDVLDWLEAAISSRYLLYLGAALFAIHPFAWITVVTGITMEPLPVSWIPLWQIAIGFVLVQAGVLCFQLRRAERRLRFDGPRLADPSPKASWRLIDRLPEWMKRRPRVWQSWPIIWKDVADPAWRQLVFWTLFLAVEVILFFTILDTFILSAQQTSVDIAVTRGFTGITALIAFLMVFFHFTASFSKERSHAAWETLLTSPLSGRDMILSKAIPAFACALLLILFLLPPWIIAIVAGAMDAISLPFAIFVLISIGWLVAAISVHASAISGSVNHAQAIGIMALMMCSLTFPVLISGIFMATSFIPHVVGAIDSGRIDWPTAFLLASSPVTQVYFCVFTTGHLETDWRVAVASVPFLVLHFPVGMLFLWHAIRSVRETENPRNKLTLRRLCPQRFQKRPSIGNLAPHSGT